MKIIVHVIVLLAVLLPASSVQGSVQRWSAFPGWNVQSVPFRANVFSGDDIRIIDGGDRHMYIGNANALFRLENLGGETTLLARCPADQPYAADGLPSTDLWCIGSKSITSVSKFGTRRSLQLPVPTVHGSGDHYLTTLTDASSQADGTWFFAFGFANRVGEADANGSTYRDLAQPPRIWKIAAAREGVYGARDGCSLVLLVRLNIVRNWTVPSCFRSDTAPGFKLLTRGSQVWVLSQRRLATIRVDTLVSWKLPFTPTDLSVDAGGTAYVIGATSNNRIELATIAVNSVPKVRPLPVSSIGTITVDRRKRIWLTDPLHHAVTVLTPAVE